MRRTAIPLLLAGFVWAVFVLESASVSQAAPVVTAYEQIAPGLGPTLGTLDLGAGTFNPITSGQLYDDLALSPSNVLYALQCETPDCSGSPKLGTLALVTPNSPPGAQPSFQFTGIATLSNPNISSIAFSASGILYATDGFSLYTINPATGVATLIGSLGSAIQAAVGFVGGIRFDASGDLLAIAYNENNPNSVDVSEFWTVNPTTGNATFLVTPLDQNGSPLIDLLPGLVNGTLYGAAAQAQSCGAGCYQVNGNYTYSFASLSSATALASVSEPLFLVFGATAPGSSGPSLPNPVTVFSPAQGATGVSLTPVLTWNAAAGAGSYDVYFGTSTTPPFLTNTAALNYSPAVLNPNTTYYWYLISRNTAGSTPSATWSFTTGEASSHPLFFTGEVSLNSGVYYLQFPDSDPFGYYNYVASSIFYHYDMGFEAFIPGSAANIYFYDFTSSHWLYTSPTLFPFLYDFTLKTWIYYFPDPKNPGHYTSNPRYFSNLTTGETFTM